MIRSTQFFRSGTIALLAAILLSPLITAAQKNVLLIMADDYNYWTGKNGYYPQAHTPNIDALGDRGVFFTEAHSSSPVCHPSRNALWSGIHPITSGISRNGEAFIRDQAGFENITSLHQYFAQRGYYTYGGGKLWHPGRMDPNNNDVDPGNWHELNSQNTGANGGTYKSYQLTSKSNYAWSGNTNAMTTNNTNDFALATQVADFITNYDKQSPFFVACGLFRPHMPWRSPKEFWDKIDSANLAPPPGYDPTLDEPGGAVHQEIVANGKWEDAIHAYLAACALADHNVGVLMDALNSSSFKDDTIIVFVGDHGWSLGEKGHWGKFSVNDEANHTTLIIYDPSSDGNGQLCRKAVSLQDLYPTLLELSGLEPNPLAQGNSLKQILDTPDSVAWNKPIFMKYGDTEYMKTEAFRFIENGDDSELYHNPSDPHQRSNLYGQAQYNDTVSWFRSKLAAFRSEGEAIKTKLAVAPTNGGPGPKNETNDPSLSLEVYNYPDIIVPPTSVKDGDHDFTAETKRSTQYSVSLSQGDTEKTSYVMFTPNPHKTGGLGLTPDTHWTNFSFEGPIKITVTNLSGPIEQCQVYPSKKAPSIEISGNQVTFRLPSLKDLTPLQLFVRINANDMNPLLLFADPPETDIPNLSDAANVEIIKTTDDVETVKTKLTSPKPYAVFEEGIHSYGNQTGNDYPGYRLPYVSDKKVYLPGGAYVIGTFDGNDVHNSKIYGRGVLSTCGKDRLAQAVSIPYSMIHQSGGGSNQIAEGIITTDPPHFHLTYRGEVVIDNVKMIGYWHQTDGTVTGDNSVVKNTFMKTNDDYIKVYSQNCYHVNNTMFHQVNGAPFQFCWGNQNGDNNLMKDTYLIYSSYNPGANHKKNTAVICARNAPEAITENNTWDGIHIDNGCHKLLGLNAQNEAASIFRNFLIKNVELNTGNADSPQDGGSYLRDGNEINFQNIAFENLTINGDRITGENSGSDIDDDGKVWFIEGGSHASFTQSDSVPQTPNAPIIPSQVPQQ